MDYPTALSDRQKLTYCLGLIAEAEAELCFYLRRACRDGTGDEPRARLTSGGAVGILRDLLSAADFDSIGECRAAVERISDIVRDRNDALHGEWFARTDGFASMEMIRNDLGSRPLEHFEQLHLRLGIASDNAIGIATLLRFHRQRAVGRRVDQQIESNARALVALE